MHLFLDFIYLFLETREGRKKEKERYINQLPTGDMGHNPGMFPDWELNLQPFGLQPGSQSTEPYQPGCILCKFSNRELCISF